MTNKDAYSYFLNNNSLFNVAMGDIGWEWAVSKSILDRVVVDYWPDITHENSQVICRKVLPNLLSVELVVTMTKTNYIKFLFKSFARNRDVKKELTNICQEYITDKKFLVRVLYSRRNLD